MMPTSKYSENQMKVKSSPGQTAVNFLRKVVVVVIIPHGKIIAKGR